MSKIGLRILIFSIWAAGYRYTYTIYMYWYLHTHPPGGAMAEGIARNKERTYIHVYTRICTYMHVYTRKYTYIHGGPGNANPVQFSCKIKTAEYTYIHVYTRICTYIYVRPQPCLQTLCYAMPMLCKSSISRFKFEFVNVLFLCCSCALRPVLGCR